MGICFSSEKYWRQSLVLLSDSEASGYSSSSLVDGDLRLGPAEACNLTHCANKSESSWASLLISKLRLLHVHRLFSSVYAWRVDQLTNVDDSGGADWDGCTVPWTGSVTPGWRRWVHTPESDVNCPVFKYLIKHAEEGTVSIPPSEVQTDRPPGDSLSLIWGCFMCVKPLRMWLLSFMSMCTFPCALRLLLHDSTRWLRLEKTPKHFPLLPLPKCD